MICDICKKKRRGAQRGEGGGGGGDGLGLRLARPASIAGLAGQVSNNDTYEHDNMWIYQGRAPPLPCPPVRPCSLLLQEQDKLVDSHEFSEIQGVGLGSIEDVPDFCWPSASSATLTGMGRRMRIS